MTEPIATVILAAGKGTRMKSALPKVMHAVGGRPMVAHVLDTAAALDAAKQVVVVGPDMEMVADAVAPWDTALQANQLGTGDAVMAAREALADFAGTVLVLYGDTPLIRAATLEAMVARRRETDAAVVVLGFRPDEPGGYGRLLAADDGGLDAIVEAKEATPEQLQIDLCNSGVMAIDGARLFGLLDAVDNDNAKGEYYLTDIVAIARGRQMACAWIEADEAELMGVNSRADLAAAEAVLQGWLRAAAMDGGATLTAPDTVWMSWDTKLGQDVVVGPHVVFGPGVTVEDGAEIRAYSHLEGAHVKSGVTVGPYARLRPGAVLEAGSRVGNFVEVKNAVLGEGAKANHLTYIGDADVGAGANIGAGTITCNYDGYLKWRTEIGAGAFIGSNTALVAPVKVGDGAIVGAGSTVSRDVPADAIAVTRAEQKEIPRGAARFREKRAEMKAAKKAESSHEFLAVEYKELDDGSGKIRYIANHDAQVSVVNCNFIRDRRGIRISIGRESWVILRDLDGHWMERRIIPYAAQVFFVDGSKVNKGDILLEADLSEIQFVCEAEGYVDFVDIINGVTIEEIENSHLGEKVIRVIDWAASAKSAALNPRISIRPHRDSKVGQVVNLPDGTPARYLLCEGAVLSVQAGEHVLPGDILLRIPRKHFDREISADIDAAPKYLTDLIEEHELEDWRIISTIIPQ